MTVDPDTDAGTHSGDAGKHAGSPTLDAGMDAPGLPFEASCGAITIVPPIVTVTNAATGAPICDPVITIAPDGGAQDGGAGVGVSCGGTQHYGGCPATPPDGGDLACIYALLAVQGTSTIEVSAPGYASKIVPNVSSGEGGCVTAVPASQVTVSLVPLADAGADAS
jgi:hypothetical protein